MCPESASVRLQRGLSLVPALFLLIVLAGLGAVAVRLLAVSQQTGVLAISGARAYAAARAGAETAVYDALVNGNCGAQTLVLTEAGLNGFTVETSCAATSHNERNQVINIYVIDTFAYRGSYGSPDYTSRRLRMTVTDAG